MGDERQRSNRSRMDALTPVLRVVSALAGVGFLVVAGAEHEPRIAAVALLFLIGAVSGADLLARWTGGRPRSLFARAWRHACGTVCP